MLRDQLAAEELKLKLRQMQNAHRELDAAEAGRAQRDREAAAGAQALTQAEALSRRRAELEIRERRRREARRRAIIARVMAEVMVPEKLLPWQSWITAVEAGQAREEILRRLGALDVEAVPEKDLVEIADGVRDGIFRAAANRQIEAITSALVSAVETGAKIARGE